MSALMSAGFGMFLSLFCLDKLHCVEKFSFCNFAFEFYNLSLILHLVNAKLEVVVVALFNSYTCCFRHPFFEFGCGFQNMNHLWVPFIFSRRFSEEFLPDTDRVIICGFQDCTFRIFAIDNGIV